ncbi:vacuolar protein sorting-associated protein VTA1 homolog [Limulus polyphemus]|uniref:Vacuolar protein sorting-associated protein VTA1 homolog n=1 Tax=Limulus polyphemus TaxID=6850 RepID=A0ABM1BSL9_LIMPO|nr:vacuolar protein sorting-associated protein VTA1 homolog [Limulus polyphemus]XP_013787874.1 vacuolar protein sorting-associated protein VTA1 homolog [Limulus polyphemus]
MSVVLPPVPSALKSIQPLLKIASEHDKRNPVISYWCRLHALQTGLKIDKKSKESVTLLTALMDWLEKEKKAKRDNEAISNDVVAQAHIEDHALKLFMWADGEDRAERFNKNVVKSFFTAAILFDILTTFGEINEEVAHHRKYAKWKATYIHNCLKNGEIPLPGPAGNEDLGYGNEDFTQSNPNFESQPTTLTMSNHLPQNSYSDQPYPTTPSGPSSLPTSLVPPPAGISPSSGVHAPPSTPSGSSQPSPTSSSTYIPPVASSGVVLKPEHFHKAQKYCKWAGSALQYEDVATAISNLQKALTLLTTGQDE